MKKYVLFDFDGTLVNTNDVIIASWQHTYRHYLGHEVDVDHITACFGEPLLLTMEREFPGVDPQEAAEVYRSFQVENAHRLVTIFPGIRELLDALKKAGYVLGVVTSRTRESTLRYTNMFDITSCFADMVCCDDTDIHKPNPEPLLLAMKKLGATPEESIMIGDSPFDIKCANNAGVDSVMVNWRITCDETSLIDDAEVNYHISQPMELVELLTKL